MAVGILQSTGTQRHTSPSHRKTCVQVHRKGTGTTMSTKVYGGTRTRVACSAYHKGKQMEPNDDAPDEAAIAIIVDVQ